MAEFHFGPWYASVSQFSTDSCDYVLLCCVVQCCRVGIAFGRVFTAGRRVLLLWSPVLAHVGHVVPPPPLNGVHDVTWQGIVRKSVKLSRGLPTNVIAKRARDHAPSPLRLPPLPSLMRWQNPYLTNLCMSAMLSSDRGLSQKPSGLTTRYTERCHSWLLEAPKHLPALRN